MNTASDYILIILEGLLQLSAADGDDGASPAGRKGLNS